MKPVNRIFCFILDLILAAGLLFADRYTKIYANTQLKGHDPVKVIPGVFELRYLENRGAAFGMLQDKRLLFIIVGAVFLILVLLGLILLPATSKYRILRICLTAMGAGAAGNLYDRFFQDYVTDFLYFIYIDFPIFNVADIYVTLSAALLVILFIFVYKDEDLDLKKANKVKLHSSMVENRKEDE